MLPNCVTRNGGPGGLKPIDTKNSEVGVDIIFIVAPGRVAVPGVECSTRIGVKDGPCHEVLAGGSATRIDSRRIQGVLMVSTEAYTSLTGLPHNVTTTGPVLSSRSKSQTKL